jgi:hypothetical protein
MPGDITVEAAQAAHATAVRRVARLERDQRADQSTKRDAAIRMRDRHPQLEAAKLAESEALQGYRAAVERDAAAEVASE